MSWNTLVVLVSFVIYVYETCTQTATFQQIKSNCKIENTLWKITSPSLIVCGLHCWKDDRCLSVSYHKTRSMCALHDVCPSTCSSVTDGWSVYIPKGTDCFEMVGESGPCTDTVDTFGENLGLPFSDFGIQSSGDITAIKLSFGMATCTMVQVKYGQIWGLMHGYLSYGDLISIDLEPGEYIIKVLGSSQTYINRLAFVTNNRTFGFYGATSGEIKKSCGKKLIYISGQKSLIVDRLRFHWEP